MKRALSVALVGGGKVSQSFVASLPALATKLGPVKALSYRVASRVSNALRAGYPVREYQELDGCRTILVWVPESQLRSTLNGLIEAPLSWRGKSLILCGSWRGSGALAAFTQRGAACASLMPISAGSAGAFLAEGAREAPQRIRELVGGPAGRVLEISPAAKPLFLAGLTLARDAPVPLLVAAAASLRAAGVSTAQALSILGAAVDQSARAYAKAGRKAWNPRLTPNQCEGLLRQKDALVKIDPALARFFLRSLGAALELFEQDTVWLTGGRANQATAKAQIGGD